MKLLNFKFENARLFLNHDFKAGIYGYGNGYEKSKSDYFIKPITKFQIANVLRVLFDQRPIPTKKACFYGDRNDRFMDMALKSYLKIDSPTNGSDDSFFEEIVHTRKGKFNSWYGSSKSDGTNTSKPTPTWEILRSDIIEDEDFQVILKMIEEIVERNPLSDNFLIVCEEIQGLINDGKKSKEIEGLFSHLQKLRRNEYIELIKSGGKNQITTYLRRTFQRKNGLPPRLGLTNVRGISRVISISGELVVPMTQQEIEEFSRVSTGHCRILDGGIVYLQGIYNPNFFSYEGFESVENISIETFAERTLRNEAEEAKNKENKKIKEQKK